MEINDKIKALLSRYSHKEQEEIIKAIQALNEKQEDEEILKSIKDWVAKNKAVKK